MGSKSLIFILLTGLLFIFPKNEVVSQSHHSYSFLREDLNVINNHRRGLQSFYMRLAQLEAGKTRTVNIVHIGDSHIQADWFSGKVRTLLQAKFGSAGRGLVFPYSVARTNSPEDIKSSSSVYWQARRNIERKGSLPIGISGITLETGIPEFKLKLGINPGPDFLHYRFNKITVFTERGPSFSSWKVANPIPDYEFRKAPSYRPIVTVEQTKNSRVHVVKKGENLTMIGEQYGMSVKELMSLNKLENDIIYPGKMLKIKQSNMLGTQRSPMDEMDMSREIEESPSTRNFMQQFYLSSPVHQVSLKGDGTGNKTRMYGVVLENYHQSGILYHMIGVNGAKFTHYNGSPKLHEHIQALRPDLIIVSLGTNEAVNGYFNESQFEAQVDELIHELEKYNRFADIILTTPPDSYKNRSYPNPVVGKISGVLSRYAIRNDLACWNFYELMGGKGSISSWYKSNLAQNDKLHLTKSGYLLQGQLLYEALIKGYESYRDRQ
ncbi:MAG: LysM peptidoglycan-binding domain-containing protein [Bacteroidota bacterium]